MTFDEWFKEQQVALGDIEYDLTKAAWNAAQQDRNDLLEALQKIINDSELTGTRQAHLRNLKQIARAAVKKYIDNHKE